MRPHIDQSTMQVSESFVEVQNTLSNVAKFLDEQKKSKLEANVGLLDNLAYGNGNFLEDSIADASVRVKHKVREFQNTKSLNSWFDTITPNYRILQIIPHKINVGQFSETTLYTVHYVILEDIGTDIPEKLIRTIFGEQK